MRRALLAITFVLGCRREPPHVEIRPAVEDASAPQVSSATADAADSLVDRYGAFAEQLEGRPFTDLPVSILGSVGKGLDRPARVGWVDHAEHGRIFAILGPVMVRDFGGSELRVQAYGERSPDRPLLTKSGDSTQWTTMRAMWDAQPTATLLVLLDAKGTPVHVREIGAVLKIEEVALFAGEPTFFVQRLGSRSGVDDEIPLDVWVLHDDDLVRLASYPLGMRDVSPCGDGGSCALGPPGSVTIAGRTPPRLRIRIDDAHHTPADVEAGFMGIEREETWDESKRAFVSGPSHPVRLKGVRRPL